MKSCSLSSFKGKVCIGRGRGTTNAAVHLQEGNKCVFTWDFHRRSAKPNIQLKHLPDFDLQCNLSLVLAINDRSEGKGGEWGEGIEGC